MNTISEEQVLHNELSFEINQELIHLMKRIIEIQKQNTELKEENKRYKELGFKHLNNKNNRLEDNWNKLKEWLEEVQINGIDIDEWTIIEVRNKVGEIEKGGMNE